MICIDNTPYVPAFIEDFRTFSAYDGSSGTWDTHFAWGRTNPHNQERQIYVDRAYLTASTLKSSGLSKLDPFRISKDGLTIVADRTPVRQREAFENMPYVSGVITTRHSFAQTYGYFEARVRVPQGKGLWPAVWMLPVDGYPPEIDIMEALGDAPASVYQTVHPPQGAPQSFKFQVSDASIFHTYGVKWTVSEIAFYIDGEVKTRVPNSVNQPMYLLANLAVGGKWPGDPDSKTAFPAMMNVRFLHAFSQAPGACSKTP